MFSDKTIAALATPPGTGGIAVVRISGRDAFAVADRVFQPVNPEKSIAAARGYTALYGSFRQDGQRLDDGVALVFRAPHSYTGEDVVELSCHGGSAVAAALVEACLAAGAAPAGRGEFTRRAFLNGKLDLTQAEAVMSLINAGSRQGAALAESTLRGVLAQSLRDSQQKLTELRAHLAAWVDFPEEDVPQLEDAALRQTLSQVKQQMDGLIGDYRAGTVLREGVECAILGRPNVGKSTLLNLLAGFDRAIVTPVAGTTRDVVEQPVILAGVRLNLADTAGLRTTRDEIEAEGIRRSYDRLRQAGLILAVFDGGSPWETQDEELAGLCAGRCAIALVNKSDLPRQWNPDRLAGRFARVLEISAKDPAARAQVEQAVGEVLGTADIDPNAAALCTQRQLEAALRAAEALGDGLAAIDLGYGLDAVSVCADDALNALYALTGENAGEAVIETVFERFCVGK